MQVSLPDQSAVLMIGSPGIGMLEFCIALSEGFSAPPLAGTVSWETRLRAGNSAGFCFGSRRPPGFGSSSVPAPPKKQPLVWRACHRSPLLCPARSGGRKGDKA